MNRKPFLVRWLAAFRHFSDGLLLARHRKKQLASDDAVDRDMQNAMDDLDASLRRAGIEPLRRGAKQIAYNKDGVPR